MYNACTRELVLAVDVVFLGEVGDDSAVSRALKPYSLLEDQQGYQGLLAALRTPYVSATVADLLVSRLPALVPLLVSIADCSSFDKLG